MIGLTFSAPTGTYGLRQVDDMSVEVTHGGISMVWSILTADPNSLSGMTRGAVAVWGDEFWWQLTLGTPASIEYWGNGVLVRKDREVTQ